MKPLYKTILLIAVVLFTFSFTIKAQKDTTELKVGKKKLMIVEEKTQKENAIYNLQKAKESFEKEIVKTKELIKQQEELIKQREELLKQQKELLKQREEFMLKTKKFVSKKSTADLADNDTKQLLDEEMKILLYKNELEKLKTDIEKQKLLIELNRKKQIAFEQGIEDINKGIDDIQNGLNSLNDDLKTRNEKYFHKEFRVENRNRSSFNAHWAGFEFGILNFLNAKGSLASNKQLDYLVLIPEKTMSYSLNILEFDIALSKNKKFGAATGAGLRWNSLALKQNINLYEDENGNLFAEYIDPSVMNFSKNKLNIVYVSIPLIIEYQIPIKHRKFFIGAGITGGIRAWSKQKQKYKINGQTYKNKKTDDFQLALFRYGATARIGYGDIGFFVNYNFLPLLNEGAGPELFPISVGLKIADF